MDTSCGQPATHGVRRIYRHFKGRRLMSWETTHGTPSEAEVVATAWTELWDIEQVRARLSMSQRPRTYLSVRPNTVGHAVPRSVRRFRASEIPANLSNFQSWHATFE
jgi:hypothetical protein